MTERERWIVYPLLFLALGTALRDKLFDQTTSKRIVCQELTVVDEEPTGLRPPRILAKIGRADGNSTGTPPIGYLFVNGQLEVDGPIVARQYGTRGVPYVPALPGITPADILRALQQSAQAWQGSTAPDAQPTETAPVDKAVPATEPAPREKPADEKPAGGDPLPVEPSN